jgi:hypothetical protein
LSRGLSRVLLQTWASRGGSLSGPVLTPQTCVPRGGSAILFRSIEPVSTLNTALFDFVS